MGKGKQVKGRIREGAKKMCLSTEIIHEIDFSSEKSINLKSKLTDLKLKAKKRALSFDKVPAQEAINNANENYKVAAISQYLTVK